MSKSEIQIRIEVIKLIYSKLQSLYIKKYDEDYPSPEKMTHYMTPDNYNFKNIRELLIDSECHIHPKNIYYRIIQPLRNRDYIISKEPLFWDYTSTVNNQLVKLVDPNSSDIEDFVKKNKAQFTKKVFDKQSQIFKAYHSNRNNKESGKSLKSVYHLYVSKTTGIKIGLIGFYNDNSSTLILDDEDNTEYVGEVYENNQVIKHIRFKKIENFLREKENIFHEISFYFFSNDKDDKLFFQEGIYSGINTNNRPPTNPSLVTGPFILEKSQITDFNKKLKKEWLNKIKNISPVIKTLIANKRIEVTNDRQWYPNDNIEKPKEKEIEFINRSNAIIKNPNELLGKFVLLIFSPTYNGFRKLTFTINKEFVLQAKAVQASEQSKSVYYEGYIEKYSNGLLSFKVTNVNEPINYISGVLEVKNISNPMYGVSSGVFNNAPKQTPIVFIKENSDNSSLINFNNPEIIDLESEDYTKINEFYDNEITSFFSGKSGYNWMLSTTSEKLKTLELRLKQDSLLFDDIKGIYEQYYLDYTNNSFRKDYVQIRPSGEICMIGMYRYVGTIDKFHKNITFQLHSKEKGPRPIQGSYNIINGDGDEILLIGSFNDIIERQNSIISSRDVWYRVSTELESNEVFFKRKFSKFEINDEFWINLPQIVKENLSSSTLHNRIISSVNKKKEKLIANSLFLSCCQTAQIGDFNNSQKALKILQLAIDCGFDDKEKLNEAIKPGGVLAFAAKNIDVENLTVDL